MRTYFDKVTWYNRWMLRKALRPGDWTIIGVSKFWGGWDTFYYKICLFGFEVRIWFWRSIGEKRMEE